jgi:hypothetical protein
MAEFRWEEVVALEVFDKDAGVPRLDLTNHPIYPGGRKPSRRVIQFAGRSQGHWCPISDNGTLLTEARSALRGMTLSSERHGIDDWRRLHFNSRRWCFGALMAAACIDGPSWSKPRRSKTGARVELVRRTILSGAGPIFMLLVAESGLTRTELSLAERGV